MQKDIEDLQARLAFQDDTIQEMTDRLLDQQRQIDELKVQINHLHGELKAMRDSGVASLGEETPPPHY